MALMSTKPNQQDRRSREKQWEPDYDETITQSDEEAMGLEDSNGERDELFEDALRICVDMKRASTSVLQRRLHWLWRPQRCWIKWNARA